MKFCPKCGAVNTNDSTKCSCGEDLLNVTAENAKTQATDKQIAKAPKSAAFMDSASCKSMVLVFILLAVICAFTCATILESMSTAVIIAVMLIVVAITFSALGGLLKNQEIQNELLQEILNELKNKK